MKRYTLRGLIHDAKLFNQLRREYRRDKKKRRKDPAPVRLPDILPAWADRREVESMKKSDTST